jgi:hypothetical protein
LDRSYPITLKDSGKGKIDYVHQIFEDGIIATLSVDRAEGMDRVEEMDVTSEAIEKSRKGKEEKMEWEIDEGFEGDGRGYMPLEVERRLWGWLGGWRGR